MMQQIRKMQQDMARVQEELANTIVEGSASGGLVTVGITGEFQVKKVTIKPDAVDPDDVETLEDLLVVALNDALGKVHTLNSTKMGAVTGGLKIPGM
ncbi:MAG: YbaB/EbfC family nucleoid-associated protein [Candidatus Eremiobacteraeota bacterium]|nr:YbaB/EbfC family nucleoid-associated protein [Candidatus Eremiobacteraeota bacterium]MDB5094991.1 YbaB/EbfC family nucleoid-associated protein [Candidatus Eremiobacteraeota bacterium]